MSAALMTILAVCAGVAGTIGWPRATGRIYRQPLYRVDLPAGVTRRAFDRQRRRRRKLQRLFVTAFYAMTGMAGGVVFLLVVNHR